MAPSRRERLERWWKKPLGRKAASISFHLRRSTERALALGLSALDVFDGPLVRGARFEHAVGRERVLLTEGREQFLVFTHDQIISKTLFRTGEFDFEKFERVLRLLGRERVEVLVDVGANIGTICIPAVNRGFAARAIAIEPEPANFRLLSLNVELNALGDRITRQNVALGDRDGQELELELAPDNSGDHRIRVAGGDGTYAEGERRVIRIPSQTLDTLAGPLDPARTLVWMDTQGYEGHILGGASALLERRVPLVTELWPYGLERTGGLERMKTALRAYESFFDLSTSEPRRQPVRELDALVDRLARGEDYTDVLLL